MVPLRLGLVEGGQDFELSSRHCSKLSIASRLLALVLQLQDLDGFLSRHKQAEGERGCNAASKMDGFSLPRGGGGRLALGCLVSFPIGEAYI
jgi:hypothetical protein